MVGYVFHHVLPPSLCFIAQEIATLRKEAQAFQRVRAALRSPDSDEDAAKLAFEKV
jgi:hypothetical protein